MNKAAILEAMIERMGGGEEVKLSPAIRARRLLDHYEDISRKHDFKPGDLVVLKCGVDFFKHPNPGEPCVVLEVLSEPIKGEGDGTPEQGANLDLRVIVITACGALSLHLFESRIFEPYAGPVESK